MTYKKAYNAHCKALQVMSSKMISLKLKRALNILRILFILRSNESEPHFRNYQKLFTSLSLIKFIATKKYFGR